MGTRLVLAMALVLSAGVGFASEAAARTVAVRFTHPNAAGVTAFRIYVRQAGQSYGAPAWSGLPTASGGVYTANVTAPDVTLYATASAVNTSGESVLSNEIEIGGGGAVCGNAFRESPEQCDDGNTRNGDGCSATCTVERVPACGDGIRDTGEQCDDGNTRNGDGCRSACTGERRAACGCGPPDHGEEGDRANSARGPRSGTASTRART